MKANRWTKDQLQLAFYLYCQLPFGKLHKGNPRIIELASSIGRTPSAVAMKLVNFASLDPAITSSGRKGLEGASNLDREIWNEFHANWDKSTKEAEARRRALGISQWSETENTDDTLVPSDFTGETRRVLTEQRVKQGFFRRAVLSSYRGRCCMSGLTEPRLLIASHILPWSKDKANRLNPSNGLCLSAIHDKAFDKGLITISEQFRVIVSEALRRLNEPFLNQVFLPLDKHEIEMPDRFLPDPKFLAHHRTIVFIDNRKPKNG